MIVLRCHFDKTPVTDGFWWIDSPQIPSLYASASTIVAARDRALDRLALLIGRVPDVRLEIVVMRR